MIRQRLRADLLSLIAAACVALVSSCGSLARGPVVKPLPIAVSLKAGGDSFLQAAWSATLVNPASLRLTHGNVTATVVYPVHNVNTNFDQALRFRILVGKHLVVDKLDDTMPVDLRVVSVEGGQQVVILDSFSGGAHCCFGTSVVALGGNGQDATFANTDWGDVGYKLMLAPDKSGYVFLTADDAMAYAFSSFGGSTFPVMVLSFRAGHFVDVTNAYPALLQKDASQHWHEYLTDASSYAHPESALVAYLADEYRLGAAKSAWTRVRAAHGDDPAFYSKAQSWLSSNGYLHSSIGSIRVSPRS